MWKKLTQRARQAVYFAQEEAKRLGHTEVSTEHLLFGLIYDDSSMVVYILHRMSVGSDAIRTEIDHVAVRGNETSEREMRLSRQAKRVINLTYEEVMRLKHDYIGTEHLLLGLIRQEDGVAGRVLVKLGVHLDRTREEILIAQSNDSNPIKPGSPEDKRAWDRFTERARSIFFYAHEEAGLLGQTEIATEHILLGLLRDEDDAKWGGCMVAIHILRCLGVTVEQIRAEVESKVTCGEGRMGKELVLTPLAHRVHARVYYEAGLLGKDYVGTEHILLGLIRDEQGLAGRVLASLGVDITRARQEIAALPTAK
ncbi:MAG: repeat containing protein [Chthonomonadales bacterium]|nr:repeat containing protein [Chthonomonadales bacterium]